MDITTYFAREAGVSAEEAEAARNGPDEKRFSPAENAALRLAEGMTRTPAKVEQADFDAVRQAWGDVGAVELAAAVATENFSARFNHAFEIPPAGLAGRKTRRG